MKLGLRGRITLTAAAVVVAAMTAIVLATGYVFADAYSRALHSRAEAIAQGLALQLERLLSLGLKTDDVVGFEDQCAQTVSAYEGLAFALVAKENGDILFHSDRAKMIGREETSDLLDALRDGRRGITGVAGQDRDILVASAGVLDAERNRVATVVVGFPRSVIAAALYRMLTSGILVGTVALVAGLGVLIWGLSRYVTRPLTRFVATIERIRTDEPDLSLRVPTRRNDEVGVMIDGFNRLLDHIAAREKDLIRARDMADSANRAKSEFLATMSHEIRTPMNAVLGMNELLLRTELNPRQQRLAGNVRTSGRALLAIINDILDFSRIEAGQMQLARQPFDLAVTVTEAVDLLAALADQKGLDVACEFAADLPAKVVGDAGRLGQILTNLVGNAIKFTDAGNVRVRVLRAGKDLIRFEVADTGIGVDPATAPALFEPFSQADGSYARRHGGTGLGLAIAKDLVHAMAGQIGVEPREGGGSTFWFVACLPCPDVREFRPAPAPASQLDAV